MPPLPAQLRTGLPAVLLAGALPGVLAGVLATACWSGAEPASPPIRIGAGSTAEQEVLAAVAQAGLEQAGHEVVVIADLGDALDVRDAMADDQVDLYWDYTGSAWSVALGRAQPPTDPEESYEAVRAADLLGGVRWLEPTRANATLALVVRAEDRPADPGGTLTWLAGQLATAPGGLCADPDFLRRPSGFAALAEAYAISGDVVGTSPMGEARTVSAVASGRCYAGLVTATSGRAAAAGLRTVVDDQRVFPAFVVAPVVAVGGRADVPSVTGPLESVTRLIDTEVLAAANARVIAGEDPGAVAEDLLPTE